MSKSKKWKVFSALLVVSCAIILAVIMKVKRGDSSREAVEVITPVYGDIRTVVSTTGTVQPQNRLEIKPINGRVEEVLVEEGNAVKAGQVLAWMSSSERAALLDAARFQGEEEVEYWKEVYKPTPLIAPIDGEVIVRAVEPGQTVSSSDVVIVLSDRLIVKAQVDETDIGKVKLTQDAVIGLDAYPWVKVRGKVDHISYESEVVNNVTIYEVDVLPGKVLEMFRSGMSANVDIIHDNKENVLLVPLEAVSRTKEGDFVLLSQGSGKEPLRRKVELGVLDDENVEIVSGITAEDRIIVKTQKYLPSGNTRRGRSPFMPR